MSLSRGSTALERKMGKRSVIMHSSLSTLQVRDGPVQSSLTGTVGNYPGRDGRGLVGLPSQWHTTPWCLSPHFLVLYKPSSGLGTLEAKDFYHQSWRSKKTPITTNLGFPHLCMRGQVTPPASFFMPFTPFHICLLPSADVITEEINKTRTGSDMQVCACLFLGGLKEAGILLTGFLTCYWPKPDALHYFLLELLWPSGFHFFQKGVWHGGLEFSLVPFKAKTKGDQTFSPGICSVC